MLNIYTNIDFYIAGSLLIRIVIRYPSPKPLLYNIITFLNLTLRFRIIRTAIDNTNAVSLKEKLQSTLELATVIVIEYTNRTSKREINCYTVSYLLSRLIRHRPQEDEFGKAALLYRLAESRDEEFAIYIPPVARST